MFPVEYSLHELERTQKEKEITQILDYLQTIKNLMEITLRLFYSKDHEFETSLRDLIIFISRAKLIELIKAFSQEEPEDIMLEMQ